MTCSLCSATFNGKTYAIKGCEGSLCPLRQFTAVAAANGFDPELCSMKGTSAKHTDEL